MTKSCETCKHYSCFEGDDYHQGIYQAVFRNSCEIHEEARYRYWEDSCEQWEGKEKEKRLYIAYSKDWGLWCIYNTQDPTRCIPLDGYTDENNDMQRKAAQDVCDMFEWNLQ